MTRGDRRSLAQVVVCVKFCKLIMVSGEATIPLEPPSLARQGRRARGAERGVAPIPLVDLSEPQAALFNLSRCASLR